ncbi:MAG TPA: hypothetical protein VGS97_03755 [Actinocrinis sp.]|uniref:hypothetical protein n=1 Tax=Actinocrinis sp. TaxID=1920516 RepID=UPI002DDD5126|nr:hypothetical protein [Actinocrinis sp.]HEV2343183.1 hypothetical protein [Actinocrinis sp.]
MDHANPFETPTTYRLHRLEYLVAFAVVIGLGVAHFHQIRWWPAVGLFLYIDLIGYIPGAIAYQRAPGHRIGKGYYVAYNTMHSMVTQGAVIGLWMWLVKPEWALLAIPFHLFGDRGLFGNFLKPFGLPFEPEHNEAYERLISALSRDPKKIAAAVPHRTPEPVR